MPTNPRLSHKNVVLAHLASAAGWRHHRLEIFALILGWEHDEASRRTFTLALGAEIGLLR
jgi:hypothetical protein